jgi:hypothetical protein
MKTNEFKYNGSKNLSKILKTYKHGLGEEFNSYQNPIL